MNIQEKNQHAVYFLILVFASILLFSSGILVQNVFAMGQPPGTCYNEYAATIIAVKINNGTQTFDPIAHPGLTFQVNSHSTYSITDTVRIPSQSSQGNTMPGSWWEGNNYYNFQGSGCSDSYVNPNQEVTEGPAGIYDAYNQAWPKFTQQVTIETAVNSVTYNVEWINPSSTTAPSSPQNLVATAISSSQINLSWTVPSSNGGSAIMGYQIEKSTDSGATWSTIVPNTGSTNTTYSDTGLSPNTNYNYRVSASNSAGTSQPSNTASATTQTANTVPAAPTNLLATSISSSQINLSWKAPASDGGSPITGYRIRTSDDGGTTWYTLVKNTGSLSTTHSVTGLQPSTTHYYRVFALNSVGFSHRSNTAFATTPLS